MIILLLVNLVSSCINLKKFYANRVEPPSIRRVAFSLTVFCSLGCSVAVLLSEPSARYLILAYGIADLSVPSFTASSPAIPHSGKVGKQANAPSS